jgi:hypothetical protein
VKKKPGKKRTKIREVKGMRERMKNEEKEETGWPILDCRAGRLFHRPFWPTSSPAVIILFRSEAALRVVGFYKGDEPGLSKFIILGQMQYIGPSSSLWRDKIALEHAILILDHIIAPFQRLHSRHEFKGTGIELSICRKIVERRGGRLPAKSMPGLGAIFIIHLPVKREGLQRECSYLKNFLHLSSIRNKIGD